jgi:hypothetical protein
MSSTIPADILAKCTPEQRVALLQLQERLTRAEAAVAKGSVKGASKNGKQAAPQVAKPAATSNEEAAHPSVNELKSKFENKRSSKVLTAVARALRFGKDAKPPQRPMTLARSPRQANE